MFTLRFANSARPNFPTYKAAHSSLDEVALEILRISETHDFNSAAHSPLVEDGNANDVTHIVPTVTRQRLRLPRYSNAQRQASGAKTQALIGYDLWLVTLIGGREVSRVKQA